VRALISFVGIALFAAGCFNPSVKNGGFACDPTVVEACPTGFYCVNQRCVDHPGVSGTGGNGTGDMSLATDDGGADMSTPTGPTGPADMAVPVATPDLAQPPDLAKPVIPPDLAQPPVTNTCAHDLCTSGTKLKSGCSACATAVCAQDAYCCATAWDGTCVTETDDYCDTADQC
jgi:hypothetical protein